MKKNVTLTLGTKEAVALLSADLPKSVSTKLLRAFRDSTAVTSEPVSPKVRKRRGSSQQEASVQ